MWLLLGVSVLILRCVYRLLRDPCLQHLLKVAYPVLEGRAPLLKVLRSRRQRRLCPGRCLVSALSRLDENTAVKSLLAERYCGVLETGLWTGRKQSRGA